LAALLQELEDGAANGPASRLARIVAAVRAEHAAVMEELLQAELGGAVSD
jgi:hypothetical protein